MISCTTSSAFRLIIQCQSKPCREVFDVRPYRSTFHQYPLAPEQALQKGMASASHRRALPLLHRSYWLMRQTKTLPLPSVVPIAAGLCRSPSAPAGNWPFPTLSLQSLYRCLDPYPVASLWCIYSLLPKEQRPHLRREKFGTPNEPCNATSTGGPISGLQSFLYVQAPILARPPGCTHR